MRKLPPAESASLRAMFHAAMGRPVEARAAIAEARKDDPKAAASYVAEGLVADRDNKPEEAKAAYTKAAELETTNAYAYYRLAQLTWQPNASKETLAAIEHILTKAVGLQHALRRRLRLAGRGADVSRQPRRARPHPPRDLRSTRPRRVTACAPRSVLMRQGKPAEARADAQAALALAETDQERQEAQRLLDAAMKAAAAPAK